jgi:hypothetical protein
LLEEQLKQYALLVAVPRFITTKTKTYCSLKNLFMKTKLLFSYIVTGFASVILIMSCSKDAPSQHTLGSSQSSQSLPKIVNIEARNWQQQSYQRLFIDFLSGVMQGRSGKVYVYLETDKGDIQLSSTHTAFMSGEIWVEIGTGDITLNYLDHTSNAKPFNSLNIKLVFD